MSLRGPGECLHVFNATATSGSVGFGITPVPTQRIYVYRLIVTIGAPAVTVQIQDLASTAISQQFQLSANGSIVLDTQSNGDPWYFCSAGQGLQFIQSGTTPLSFDVWYLIGP